MGKRYPEQSDRQRQRASRYQNYPMQHQSPRQVTHGLKRSRDRAPLTLRR